MNVGDAITRLERCAAGDMEHASLDRDSCRLLLELWVAANVLIRDWPAGQIRQAVEALQDHAPPSDAETTDPMFQSGYDGFIA